ncbi:MAG: hypothetical protein DMD99_13835 [Candidatus Rokuibacteriota bacterium]|nr:MAG: hypothetical protein DMD99_13835 [Candidatus Rokubacteria bacterium]
MSECKHGLKTGCSYCHGTKTPPPRQAAQKKRMSPLSRLGDKMNDRMTALKRRLRELRGE